MLGFKHIHDDKAFQEQLEAIRAERRDRFRMLVCIDGSDASYEGLRFAKKLAGYEKCDIVLLYVRPIDQGLQSGACRSEWRGRICSTGVWNFPVSRI